MFLVLKEQCSPAGPELDKSLKGFLKQREAILISTNGR